MTNDEIIHILPDVGFARREFKFYVRWSDKLVISFTDNDEVVLRDPHEIEKAMAVLREMQ